MFLTAFGPHHFWPTPLLAQTASWPLFDQNRFVPKPLRTILDTQKPWPMGLLFGTICCSCLVFWAMDLLAKDPSLPKTTLCGMWCGVSVCVQNFRKVQDLGAHPDSPSAGPPSAGQPQNFVLFFHLPPQFSFFLPLLGVLSWNFGGVIEGRDPQMCTFGFLGLSCEAPAVFAKTILQLICPPGLPKKSMTNYYKFCLYPEKKGSNTPKFTTPPPTFGTHTSWPSLFLGCCLCCFLLLLCLLLVFVAAFGPPTVEPPSPPTFAVFDLPKC